MGNKLAPVIAGVVVVGLVGGTHGHHGHHAHGAAARAVAFAQSKLGDPYLWGAQGPGAFDCSGLTWKAYRGGIPRTSETQWAALPHVSRADLQPGDLVFSYWDVDNQPSPNHVQIYVGGGQIIGADTTDVERTPLSADAGHIVGYARPGGA